MSTAGTLASVLAGMLITCAVLGIGGAILRSLWLKRQREMGKNPDFVPRVPSWVPRENPRLTAWLPASMMPVQRPDGAAR